MKQLLLDVHPELIVDLFAGGGGMSTAFEMALGRSPDIAINHNEEALSMHRANHPQTRHFIADVYEVCPKGATQGRPVGWLHLSPDCTHHSQAAGGQPRSKKIRGLSWVGYRWAGQVAPRVISLENVVQILKWGPLIAKRDKGTGRVITLDMVQCPKTGKMVNRIAEPGERVPVQRQFLVPDPKRAGQTWKKFVAALHALGYHVEYATLNAADFGGHTTRERLFMIARRDGEPIQWPEPTHFKNPGKGQQKWRAAAECIDWSIPCPSIFGRKKPLAEATLRRIAKGIQKYVLNNADPFIVPIAHYNGRDSAHSISDPLRTITSATKGGEFALTTPMIVPATHQGSERVHDIEDPFRTITAAHRGEMMLTSPVLAKIRGDSAGTPMDVPMPTITSGGDSARPAGAPHALGVIAPTLVQAAHGEGKPGGAKRWGSGARNIADPVGTVTASGGHALAAATLVQTGYGEREGQAPRTMDIEAPLGTIVGTGKHAVTTAYLMQANGGFNVTPGHDVRRPMSTVTNSGSQQQIVMAHLAHLHGNCDARDVEEPLRTVSAGGQHHAVVSAFLSRQFGKSIGEEFTEPMPTTTAGGGGKSALASAFLASYYTDDSNRCRDIRDPSATITTENRLGLVECTLSQEHEADALRVAAFLMRYYGEGGQWGHPGDPMATITTKDRLALVTVMVQGIPHVIVDIGLRMLQPRELYRGQDFPESYIIERGHDGREFSKSAQVRMCGNSVDPLPAAAFIEANARELSVRRKVA